MDLRKEEDILEYRLDLAEEKGNTIGKEEGKIEVAKAMLANNVDVNTLVKFTGLSIRELEELSVNGYIYVFAGNKSLMVLTKPYSD